MSEPIPSPSSENPESPNELGGAGIDSSSAQPVTPQPKPAPEKPRKRRRWRWVAGALGALLLLLVLMVVLAPTLASMGWARAIVVGQVNKNLNGRLEIAEYSVAWTGGVKASGIRVYDADNASIVEIASVSTQLSLLDALRGRYNCGETSIRGVGFTFKKYADGTTNIDRLLTKPNAAPESAKKPPVAPQEPGGPQPPSNPPAGQQPEKPFTLPPLRIHLLVADCHGTVEQQGPGASHFVHFDGIDGDVNITDINSPIDHALKVVARVDDGRSQGTLTEKGTLAVVTNSHVDPAKASVKETIALGNFDLAGAAPFLPPSVRQLAGMASGNISIDAASGKSGTIDAALDVRKAAIALASFDKEESLLLDRVNLTLPAPTTIDMSGGGEHWADWALKVGDGRTQQITLVAEKDGVKLLDLTLAADVTPGQAMDLAANRRPARPGTTGRIELITHADPGRLFQLMPKTLALKKGVELKSALLQYTFSADFAPASASLGQSLELSEVKGRNTVENRDIAIEPLQLSFKGTSFGGGWQMPDLRDLALAIRHGEGLSADFQGKTLTTVNGALHLKPRDVLAEVGQFIDLGDKKIDGDVTLTAKAEGELVNATNGGDASKPAVSTFHLQLATRELQARGFGPSPASTLAQKFVGMDVDAEVDRNRASGQVEAIKGLKFVARAGEEAQPNIVADLEARTVNFQDAVVTDPKTGKSSTVRAATVPEFKANKLGIGDLKLAQADFGAFLPFLKDIRIDRGSVSLAGTTGSYDGPQGALGFQVFPRLDELTAYKLTPAPTTAPAGPTPAPAGPVEIVTRYSLVGAIGGKYSSADGATRLSLSNVSVTDSPQWLTIAKAGDGAIEVTVPPDGPVRARGGIKLTAELAPFNEIATKLASAPADASANASGQPHPMKLTNGRLEGTLSISEALANAIGLSVELDATGLTLRGDGPGVKDESLRLVLQAIAPGDLSQLSLTKADVTGSVVTAKVSNAVVWLRTGTGKDARRFPVLQMLRELSASVDVPDAGKFQAMVDALLPATPAAKADASRRGGGAFGYLSAVRRETRPGSVRLIAERGSAPQADRPRGGARAVSPPAPTSPPAAPVRAKLTGGSVSLKLNVTNKDNQLTFVPVVLGNGLAFAAGPVKYNLGDIVVKAKAIVIADAASADLGPDGQPKPVLEQISQLLVPELLVTGAGSTISLAGQPIVIKDPAYLSSNFASASNGAAASRPATLPAGKSPSINAAVSIVGDLPTLTNFLDALDGLPPTPSYLGAYSFQQTLVTRNGVVTADEKGSIQNFAVLDTDHRAPTFSEKNFIVESNLSLDASQGPATLSIKKVRLDMESSKALDVSFAGTIHDLAGQRLLDRVVADVTYDGEQLAPILRSLLAPKPTPADPKPVNRFADLRMAGKATERFMISGSYPANLPFNQAVATLSASGALAVDSLATMGLNIQKIQLPVWMDHGVVKVALAPDTTPMPAAAASPATGPTTNPGLATTASCNGGSINLAGISLDLTAPSALLTIPPETKVLDNVALNKVLAATLNGYLPVIDDTDATSGKLTATVHRCDRLPIEELTSAAAAQNAGMDFSTSFTDVQLGGPIFAAIETLGAKGLRASMRGDIPDARFQLGGGRLVIQKFDLLGGRNKLPIFKLAGKVGLSPDGLMNLTATLPPQLLKKVPENVSQYLPDQLDFPITGTKSAPRPAFDKALQKMLGQAAQKALLRSFGGEKPKQP